MALALEHDLLGSAMVALARQTRPAPECERVAELALKVLALPALTNTELMAQLLMLEAVIGVGRLPPMEGHA